MTRVCRLSCRSLVGRRLEYHSACFESFRVDRSCRKKKRELRALRLIIQRNYFTCFDATRSGERTIGLLGSGHRCTTPPQKPRPRRSHSTPPFPQHSVSRACVRSEREAGWRRKREFFAALSVELPLVSRGESRAESFVTETNGLLHDLQHQLMLHMVSWGMNVVMRGRRLAPQSTRARFPRESCNDVPESTQPRTDTI